MNEGVNFQDTGILSLLSGGNRRGGILGNDDIGADVLAAGAVADGTAVNAKIEAVGQQVSVSNLSREFDRLSDAATANERRNSDQNQETRDRLADMRSEFKDCCCTLGKEIISENAATRDLINTNARAELTRENDQLRSAAHTGDIVTAMQNQTALLLAALGNGGGHSRPS